jgi:hypothetical protein
MSTNPASFRLPSFDLETPEGRTAAHRYVASGIVDLNQAIPQLKSQIDALAAASSTSGGGSSGGGSTTAGVTSFNGSAGAVSFFPGLGGRDDETGQTAFTIQQSNSGQLLILNDAAPVAVSLNPAIMTPFFMFAMNLGAGTVTFTPTAPAVINYYGNLLASSMPLLPGVMALIQYDGTNWNAGTIQVPVTFGSVAHEWLKTYDSVTGLFTSTRPAYSDLTGLPQLANTKAPVSHEWLASYDATTGNFTQSQPDFTDISGNLSTAQLPTAGASGNIDLAPLTTLGTPGTITVVNGIITAFVNPT